MKKLTEISRLSFLNQFFSWGLSASLLAFLNDDIFSIDVRRSNQWVSKVHFLTKQLRYNAITQLQWQNEMELLFINNETLPNVLSFIDTERLIQKSQRNQINFITTPIKDKIGQILNSRYSFGIQTFTIKKGHSTIPHAHNYITSIFLVLAGTVHARNYDRLEDSENHYIIKPTIDCLFNVGEGSTISDEKNNVHWFEVKSDTAVLLNIHVKYLQTGPNIPGRLYLNPLGEVRKDKTIIAPKLDFKEATKLFA